MTKKRKKTISLRPARDILGRDELMKSKLVKMNGSTLLFVASPQIFNNKHAMRHMTMVVRVGKENVYADCQLRPKFWTANFFEPSDWFTKFNKMDEAIERLVSRRNSREAEAIAV